MNSIISETKFQLPPSNLHNLNTNPFPVALSYFPLAPSFVCKSIDFNSLWYGDFWQKIKLHIFSPFLFVSLRVPSLFTPSCWYRNACSVKLKPMHFWLRNKFAPLMRLELVQGSAMKTLFTLIFLHGGIIQRLLLFGIHDSFLWECGCCAEKSSVFFSDTLLIFLFLCTDRVSEEPCFASNLNRYSLVRVKYLIWSCHLEALKGIVCVFWSGGHVKYISIVP